MKITVSIILITLIGICTIRLIGCADHATMEDGSIRLLDLDSGVEQEWIEVDAAAFDILNFEPYSPPVEEYQEGDWALAKK